MTDILRLKQWTQLIGNYKHPVNASRGASSKNSNSILRQRGTMFERKKRGRLNQNNRYLYIYLIMKIISIIQGIGSERIQAKN